jgi:excisionase family DNA binding protein
LILWTVVEFAAWMRITTMAARCMLRRRELPAQAVIKIGRRVRLRADLVQEWVLKVTVA